MLQFFETVPEGEMSGPFGEDPVAVAISRLAAGDMRFEGIRLQGQSIFVGNSAV